MTPTDVLLTPWTAARLLAGAWSTTTCAGCARHQADARQARSAAARAHELNLALEQRMAALRRELEHHEAKDARSRPHPFQPEEVPA